MNNSWKEYARRRKYGLLQRRDFSLRERLSFAFASAGARAFSRVVSATCSMRVDGDEAFRMNVMRGGAGVIWLMWHNRVSGFFAYYELLARRSPMIQVGSIVSPSKDGELLARPFRETGGIDVRGSSSSNAANALRQSIEFAGKGIAIATVGDGPRGPRYELKPGPLMLAKATGMPIVPCTWACTRALQLHRSWDQMMIPLPFSRIHIKYGEPMQVPADAGQTEIATIRRDLERRLMRLTEWADANTRIAWQLPKPRPGEVLKRRKAVPGVAGHRR